MSARAIASLIVVLFASGQSLAATVGVDVRDQTGKPAENAVITLAPDGGAPAQTHLPEKAVIDQRHETFLPLVVVVKKGGRVVFTNNDVTMHQVYSFSPIKQFQFVIKQGEVSDPVVFDTAGVAAIGCNIHDQMIAYVFVSDAAFAAVTDANGHAEFADVPEGRYVAATWHSQLALGAQPPSLPLTIMGGNNNLVMSLPFAIAPKRPMTHMHMDY